MTDNIIYLVEQLLVKNLITFDKEELSFQIQTHPSYPSLHAITGVLTHFNIENMALQVPVDEETLSQLPKHFIAEIKTDKGSGFVLVSNQGLRYDIIFDKYSRVNYSMDEFLAKFTGIIVAVEKEETQEEVKQNKTYFNKSLVLISIFLLGAVWAMSSPNIFSSLFLIMSLLGVYVSIAIYRQEQGKKTKLGEAFCSGENKKSDCDAVINSKGANLLGLFKLSDLSLVYFSGLALFIYLIGIANLSYSFPYIISLFAVIITVYSIYYQAFVAKAWCGLCLSIVGVLWIQAIIVLSQMKPIVAFSFTIKEIILGILSFTVVSVLWFYLKFTIDTLKELKEEKIKYIKFKRNFNLFNSLLNQSESIDTQLPDISEIVFGDKKNSLPIVIVTNPFCGHCKAVHTLVEEIYSKYKDLVSITIRFNINTNNKESDLVQITSRLIELYHTEGEQTVMRAMHAIYKGQETNSWLKEWGKCYKPNIYIEVLEKEQVWCNRNKINFTPEILIAGKSFPKEYDRSDLIFFIEDLQEVYTNSLETKTPIFITA